MWPGRWPGALTMYTLESGKRLMVCGKGPNGFQASDVDGGSSVVRSAGRRSDSKKEWLPMLRLVLPESKSLAPGPMMKVVEGLLKSFG